MAKNRVLLGKYSLSHCYISSCMMCKGGEFEKCPSFAEKMKFREDMESKSIIQQRKGNYIYYYTEKRVNCG